MSSRFPQIAALFIATSFSAVAYFEVPPGRVAAVDWMHAAVNALDSRPGEPENYFDRVQNRRAEIAGRFQQGDGARFQTTVVGAPQQSAPALSTEPVLASSGAVAPNTPAATSSTGGGEAYAGERQNRIAALQRELDNIDVDIRNSVGGNSVHMDTTHTSHPDYVGMSADERTNNLFKKRAELEQKILRLKRGDPVSSVEDSSSSTGLDSMENVPRL